MNNESESIPCSRCGAPTTGVNAQDVAEIRAIFSRAPLVLCARCERRDVEECAKRAARDTGPLPEWPDEWPRRAIADLKHFKEAPLQMAHMIHEDLMAKKGTFAIIGDRGRGKTVMATWLAEQRRQRHKNPGTYTRSHDLFATIRRSWHPQSREDEWTVLERYRTTPLLVIDEFQERSESEWENRTLVNILDHRHANILPTILIANLTARAFTESVGASLVDRISQTGGIVECGWGNLRKG